MLSHLHFLKLGHNVNITGTIPHNLFGTRQVCKTTRFPVRCLHNLAVSLSLLFVGQNKITGSIPTEFGEAPLYYLYLDNNFLTGSVPEVLSQLTRLRVLNLHRNDLTGSVPNSLCDLFLEGDLYSLKADCAEVECPCCTNCYDDSATSTPTATHGPTSEPVALCMLHLVVSDQNRDGKLDESEFVSLVSRTGTLTVGTFEMLPLGVQTVFHTLAANGTIDISGSRPGEIVTLEQQVMLDKLCIGVEQALTNNSAVNTTAAVESLPSSTERNLPPDTGNVSGPELARSGSNTTEVSSAGTWFQAVMHLLCFPAFLISFVVAAL
jgi:hypothetical protein